MLLAFVRHLASAESQNEVVEIAPAATLFQGEAPVGRAHTCDLVDRQYEPMPLGDLCQTYPNLLERFLARRNPDCQRIDKEIVAIGYQLDIQLLLAESDGCLDASNSSTEDRHSAHGHLAPMCFGCRSF